MMTRPLGKPAVTFGFYSESGIPVAQVYAARFNLNGLAFSSTGQLVPPTFSPSLFNDDTPAGMHVWIKGGVNR